MEARNFITAREIIESDSWLIPTLNGEPRLAKPPLPTWITASVGLMVGDIHNETALRFPAAIMGLLMVFFLYGFTRLLTQDRLIPFLAAAVLGTSFYVMFMARRGTWDIYCHSFMLGAIWALIAGLKKEGIAYIEFTVMGLLLGLAFMSKGPVPFYAMLLPFLIAYVIAFGGNEFKNKWKEITTAIIICLVVSAWWPLYTYLHIPKDLVQNIVTETESWQNRRVRPFWHYWSFPIQSGIWTIFITVSLLVPYAKHRIEKAGGNYKFLLWWVLSTIILLSIIPEKKERYLMPSLISQALLIGFYLRYLINSFRDKQDRIADRIILLFHIGLFAIISIGGPIGLYYYGYSEGIVSLVVLLFFALIMFLLGVIFIVQLWKKNVLIFVMVTFFLMAFLSAVVPIFYKNLVVKELTYSHISELRTIDEFHKLECYSIGPLRPEELWDLRKIVTPLKDLKEAGLLNQDSIILFQSISADKVDDDTLNTSYKSKLLGIFDHPANRDHMVRIVSVVHPKMIASTSVQ